MIVRRSTGITLYKVEYTTRPILLIDLKVSTWMVINWDKVKTYKDLIAVRARILERWDKDITKVTTYLRRIKEVNKDDFNARYRIRLERL